jgi:hypothetical protein
MEPTHQREREALSRLLASGAFSRAPNLEKILVYLCEKSFEGRGGQVKEFHLATEVLGRPETFDPKKDSIVRVEIHRLRKRLKDYYDKTPGEPLRIQLPEKSYIPEFQEAREPAPEIALEVAPPQSGSVNLPAVVRVDTVLSPKSAGRQPWAIVGACAAILLLAGLLVGRRFAEPAEAGSATSWPPDTAKPAVAPASAAAVAPPPVELPRGSEIRILAGRPPGNYVDRYGNTWNGDAYFTGGEAVPVKAEIRTRGWDANLFAGMRDGNFSYDIPLPPGSYELSLLFAETVYGEGRPLGVESRRIFTILANEKPLVESLDILAEALDPNTAWTRVFKDVSPAPDGKLHLKFSRSSGGKAMLNALWIRPGEPNRMKPFRMVCRQQAYRDANDVFWEPDRYFHGGTQIMRPHGAPAGDHFQGERFGHFSYEIPAPPGKYTARLYFWEYWWGPSQPGRGGVGSRVFDVYCNHKPLLLDFDIIRRRPNDQTAIETFYGLEPDIRGVLKFDFIARSNYALLNALEILDEGK